MEPRNQRIIILALSSMLLSGSGACRKEERRSGAGAIHRPVTLAGGESAMIILTVHEDLPAGTPVSVQLAGFPQILEGAALRLRGVGSAVGPLIPAQLEIGDPPRLCWLIPRDLDAGGRLVYELVSVAGETGPLVRVSMSDHALDLNLPEGGVLRYHYAERPPPPGSDPLFNRSGFIHPVWAPGGTVLTRIHPSDHIHHMGFWWPWTKTEIAGREVDFWNLGEGQGTVRFVKFDRLVTGPVFGGFDARHVYVDLTVPEGERAVLDEVSRVRVWNLQGSDPAGRIWDLVIEQTPTTPEPVKVLKYRYGGFGFRATAEWNPANSEVLTSEGRSRVDGNGTRVRWCAASGKTDRGMAGILLMNHPSNARHPEPVRIWPEGDVFVGFCPVVDDELVLAPGTTEVRRYRILTFDVEVSEALAERHWRTYAAEPAVEVQIQKAGK